MELVVLMERGTIGGGICDNPPGGPILMLAPTPGGGGGGPPAPPKPRPGGRLDPRPGGAPNGLPPMGGGLIFFGGSGW
jgi:hypothetical protein